MSEVRLPLRVCILLSAAVLIGTCRSADDRSIIGGGPCSTMAGDANRNAPIVCVDDSSRLLKVSHETIVAHHVAASDKKPVVVQWFTKSGGGDLQIDIRPGCVTDLKCDGRGHCKAKTVPVDKETRCKYDVWITGDKHDRLDPDVVVVPCC